MATVIGLLCLLAIGVSADKDLDNFKKTWHDNIAKSKTWIRPTNYGTFDFVIVGGGTAGCVLANRLTEVKEFNVLLIEAGGDETDFSRIPAAPLTNSDMNWGYVTVPQKNACQAMKNSQCEYNRGKVLGGMSSIDYMFNSRGPHNDYDAWKKLGNNGWGFKHILPYFIKSENATLVNGNKNYHGFSGPWKLAYPRPLNKLERDIIEAHKEIGIYENDYNGPQQLGTGRLQFNINGGLRLSTNTAYLKPVLNRKNLVVLKDALATKINFHKKEAKSVQFLQNKQCHRVNARKEVILSAGAVNNVQLLMLSGIGPKKELQKLNLEVVKNLPVGQNLVDHLAFYGVPILNNQTVPQQTVNESLEELRTTRKGPFSHPNCMDVAFYRLINKTESTVPDTAITYCYDNSYYGFNLDGVQNNYTPGTLIPFFILLHPKSIGNITLKSRNPTDFPLIDPNYLSHPDDIETIYLAIKKQQELLKTPAMQKHNATLGKTPTSVCDHLVNNDRQFWYCVIRHMTYSMQYPTGVCKMGTNHKTSVVGKSLKVHGFKNLRVVGNSVAPTPLSAHASTVAVMMGEKLADVIKDKHI